MDDERSARLEEQVKAMREDLHDLKADVKSLLEWRWKLYGVTGFIAFVVTVGVEAIARAVK